MYGERIDAVLACGHAAVIHTHFLRGQSIADCASNHGFSVGEGCECDRELHVLAPSQRVDRTKFLPPFAVDYNVGEGPGGLVND